MIPTLLSGILYQNLVYIDFMGIRLVLYNTESRKVSFHDVAFNILQGNVSETRLNIIFIFSQLIVF